MKNYIDPTWWDCSSTHGYYCNLTKFGQDWTEIFLKNVDSGTQILLTIKLTKSGFGNHWQ